MKCQIVLAGRRVDAKSVISLGYNPQVVAEGLAELVWIDDPFAKDTMERIIGHVQRLFKLG